MALRRRWWVAALSLALIGGPALFYAIRMPAHYKSKAVMWMTGRLNLPEGAVYTEELGSYIGTQSELMKSDAIQSRAFERIRARFPELASGQATNTIPINLIVRSTPRNSVIELEATCSSGEAAQAFLDAVVDEYLLLKKGARQQSSSEALSGITDQIHDLEKHIQERQNDLVAFETANNVSYLTEHGVSAGGHLAKLGETISDLRTEHRLLESLTPGQYMDFARESATVVGDTHVPGEKSTQALAVASVSYDSIYYHTLQELQLARARRDEFAQALRPAHSKMIKFNREVTGLEKLLASLQDQSDQEARGQMTNRMTSIELQIQNLESQYRTWETNAAAASQKLAEYDRIKQDLQRSQSLYDRLLGLLQTVDLNKSFDLELLSPLGPASSPRPDLTKVEVAAGGIGLALIVGVTLFLILESMDDRFTSSDEMGRCLMEPVLGQIPEGPVGKLTVESPFLTEKAYDFAESFRGLRSALLFMFNAQVRPRLILVTSAASQEGKSTVAANLAASLAQSGARVLLVDADMHRSSIHRIFNICPAPGLKEILAETTSLEKAIVPTAQSGLFLLPAGEHNLTQSEKLLQFPLERLFSELSRRYEYVIVDSPPVLATDDVMSLAHNVDGVFLVVRGQCTSASIVREALGRLLKCNVRVLGTIYNRAEPSSNSYHKYGGAYNDRGASNSEDRRPVLAA